MAKYYVVWKGRHPGVYDNWDDAREQVEGFEGARYKGFATPQEATAAFRDHGQKSEKGELGSLLTGASRHNLPKAGQPDYFSFPEIDLNGWAVDAACMGNPGIMEYRGVELMTGRELFCVGPFRQGTNNIGEFLAIVHALALMAKTGEWHTIYSDSATALSWLRKKQIKTTVKETEENRNLFEIMGRALIWIRTHTWPVKVLKWQTEEWGEVPADFGRK